MMPFTKPDWWRSRTGAVFLAAAVAAALYLTFVHLDHVIKVLPLLFILACPFMHLFMHHGHGSHRHGRHGEAGEGRPRDASGDQTPDKRA